MFNVFSRLAPASVGAAESAYLQKFLSNRNENLFLGSFSSFETARAAVPVGVRVGYDNDDAAALYSTQVCSWDYAPLFWLADSFRNGASAIFDLGGHIGIKYYAFRRLLQYPEALRWTVCDVPAVVRRGEQVARQREADQQLAFCTDFAHAGAIDVLLLSGSLQYLPVTMSEILSMLPSKPARVILNITAGHSDRTFYTLNSIVDSICPYRIQSQDEVLSEIRLSGYRRRDLWRNDGKPITVPFVLGGDGAFYFGCCFDRLQSPPHPVGDH